MAKKLGWVELRRLAVIQQESLPAEELQARKSDRETLIQRMRAILVKELNLMQSQIRTSMDEGSFRITRSKPDSLQKSEMPDFIEGMNQMLQEPFRAYALSPVRYEVNWDYGPAGSIR